LRLGPGIIGHFFSSRARRRGLNRFRRLRGALSKTHAVAAIIATRIIFLIAGSPASPWISPPSDSSSNLHSNRGSALLTSAQQQAGGDLAGRRMLPSARGVPFDAADRDPILDEPHTLLHPSQVRVHLCHYPIPVAA